MIMNFSTVVHAEQAHKLISGTLFAFRTSSNSQGRDVYHFFGGNALIPNDGGAPLNANAVFFIEQKELVMPPHEPYSGLDCGPYRVVKLLARWDAEANGRKQRMWDRRPRKTSSSGA